MNYDRRWYEICGLAESEFFFLLYPINFESE